jgi:hypothetical protein
MAFLPLVDRYKFQQYDYDWLGEGSPEELGKVNNILGMPRKLLHLQHQIRSCAKYWKRADLLKEISCMRALLEGPYTQEVMVIAARTVKSYQLATSLYAYARLFWSVPLPHRLPLSNSAVVYLHVTHEFSRRPRSSGTCLCSYRRRETAILAFIRPFASSSLALALRSQKASVSCVASSLKLRR